MGGCFSVSLSCDQVLNQVSQCLCVKESFIHNLEENLAALETTMDELKARRDDLSRKVEREETRGLKRLAQVQVWLTRVETTEIQVNSLLSFRTMELQRLCLCGFCSKNLKLSYRYGKRVFMMLNEIKNLNSNGIFEVVAEKAQASEVIERPIQPTIMGREKMFDTIWNRLMEDGVGVMGLYGMGGVGKTTLLTQINNKFLEKKDAFDIVIWVVVSKDLQIQRIQEEVAKKLGLVGEDWNQKDVDQKACDILNVLKKKKFVLLLDDLWAKVDLTKIGIPSSTRENGSCKVVFTTRSREVCGRMGADIEMEVKCLAPDDAFKLFRKKVGEITLGSDPNIAELAIVVAKKCHGLPLALNVIGEAMASKRTIQEWQHAVDVLTSYAAEFSGMEDEILPILKYSYDNLKEEQAKSCLLYCALFPEDYDINIQRLINCLVCEGIIDGSEGIEKTENKGYDIIGSLVRASLLVEKVGENWDDWGNHYVCMHDVVREMALWIASDLGKRKEAFIVRAGVGLRGMPKVENWKVVKKMSLMSNDIRHLVGSPECLELTTLLLQEAKLANISREFFKSMPKLAVLDLSRNPNLSELPDSISELGSLQYLNLSSTRIRDLPKGVLELKKLIQLDLEYTHCLSSIVGISKLHNLKVLNLIGSGLLWDLDTMEELETLEHLEFLTVKFFLHEDRECFLSSHRLTSCTRFLIITTPILESFGISLPITMNKLRQISFMDCNITEIKMGQICIQGKKTVFPIQNPRNPCFSSLTDLHIYQCRSLRELTFLMFAPNLTRLSIFAGHDLEDIINKVKARQGELSGTVPFLKLVSLHLNILPKLENIYWRPLPFPCLEEIQVFSCPELKKLPLDSQSGKHGDNGLIIVYEEKEWIEGLAWEDEATKTRFLSSCKPHW